MLYVASDDSLCDLLLRLLSLYLVELLPFISLIIYYNFMKHTIPPIITLTAGLLFWFGLALSDMISPMRVQWFFDIFGSWDPTLLFVMVGALSVSLLWHFFLSKQDRPFFSEMWHFSWKKSWILDRNLILWSAIFGIGWWLSGLCPGPAIGSIVYWNSYTLVFLISMIGMMSFYKILTK